MCPFCYPGAEQRWSEGLGDSARPGSFLAVQQRIPVDHVAIDNQPGDVARVPDIHGWITVDDKNIGASAGRNLAQFIPSLLE